MHFNVTHEKTKDYPNIMFIVVDDFCSGIWMRLTLCMLKTMLLILVNSKKQSLIYGVATSFFNCLRKSGRFVWHNKLINIRSSVILFHSLHTSTQSSANTKMVCAWRLDCWLRLNQKSSKDYFMSIVACLLIMIS